MKKFIAIPDHVIVLVVRETLQLRSCPVLKRRPIAARIKKISCRSCHVYGFDKFIVEQFYFEHMAGLG